MNRHPVLAYTVARLLLFLAVLGVLYLLGARSLLLLALALLLSGLFSFWLLAGPRQAMSAFLADRMHRVNERIDEAAAAEDVEEPQRRSEEPG
jgi:hypothetical protein